MPTKRLSGYYADGYRLSPRFDRLVVDTTADVRGVGIQAFGFATVMNQGSVYGSTQGVYLAAGGLVQNGSVNDTTASITGDQYGVRAHGAVANFGTIHASGDRSDGVDLISGGSLTNGSVHQAAALISGYNGVFVDAIDAVANFGTIEATGHHGEGVYILSGGTLANGSPGDHLALIRGAIGVAAVNAANIANFGTIDISGYSGDGVFLLAGGSITNGSFTDDHALILGAVGVRVDGVGTISNFAIIATEDGVGNGVDLGDGGLITNGSAHDRTASISGNFGVSAAGAATVVNFGVLEGYSGVSVELTNASGELIAEAGSAFIGVIEGGGGRLALAGDGSGTISGLGASGKLSGAIDAYFSGFGSYEIAVGGAWALVGSNALVSGSVLVDEGTLVNRGALTLSGTLSIASSGVFQLAAGNVSAAVDDATTIVDGGLMIKSAGRGTITVAASTQVDGVVEVATGRLDLTSQLLGAGRLSIDAGAMLEADAGAVSSLTANFRGPSATLALKSPDAFLATIGGLVTGDAIDLLALAATGASVNADDQLVIVDGARTVATLQLTGNYIGATFSTGGDGHGGTNVTLVSAPHAGLPSVETMAPVVAPSASAQAFIAAMAGFAAPLASHATPGEAWAPHGALLSAPRVAIA